ncbi:MAG TPA: bifunctional glutamate N-acetyltransferase/amino-acid acetyltransferase ArgJ [Acidimicrobiales bacterium]|jgi:glutamate N-acetyltransferase/amino-acid N-acetyltransferase|nr:bifunctional glutamate N-acetyltransferase/amino-acid acetyltransferase ArgJ [Acidimicrobiales bacterium]
MSVVAPGGFVAAGVACGIKASGERDLSLVATVDGAPVAAAGVFTQNLVVAAPVVVSRRHLAASSGRAAAVVLSSGNANAGTGDHGEADAERMCALVAGELGCALQAVLVCSTGLIGFPLPMGAVAAGVPRLVSQRDGDPDHGIAAAEAIMTTDTRRKETVVRADGFVVGGMAKGAAMLAPNMATMLAVMTTDAAVDPPALDRVLRAGVADSFNAVTIDGCTSTNDTVLLLANGRSGPPDVDSLAAAVAAACEDLATQMVGDAEGHTKVVRVRVTGAASHDEARQAARKVAESQLVKCSWFGGDPYWGRVASDLGTAGVKLDLAELTVAYGGTVVSRGCVAVEHDTDAVAEHMAGEYLVLHCDLGVGDGQARILTNDLTHGYIDENRGTS